MDPRQRADAPLYRLHVGLDVVAPGQPDDRLCQRQRIFGAMVDFAGQKILPFFSTLALGDVDGDPADADNAARLVESRGRGAEAPADLAVGANNPKFGFVGS